MSNDISLNDKVLFTFDGKTLEGIVISLAPGIFDILVEEEPMVYKSVPAADVKKIK